MNWLHTKQQPNFTVYGIILENNFIQHLQQISDISIVYYVH